MKILVAYDGSKVASAAVELAIVHAKAFDAEIGLVTVFSKATDREQKEIWKAEERLEKMQTLCEKKGVKCHSHLLVRGASSGEDIALFAQENNFDEIILGVKKTSKVEKMLMGSTAQYVILSAHCPVVTIK